MGLKAMAEQKIDRILFAPTGVSMIKTNLKPTKAHRFAIVEEILKMFEPLMTFTDVGDLQKEIESGKFTEIAMENGVNREQVDGEDYSFKLFENNEQNNVTLYYLVGADHYLRTAIKDGSDDSINKLLSNAGAKLYNFNADKHKMVGLFVERPGYNFPDPVYTDDQKAIIATGAIEIKKMANPLNMDVSATIIRKALKGEKPENLVLTFFEAFDYIQKHPDYFKQLTSSAVTRTQAINFLKAQRIEAGLHTWSGGKGHQDRSKEELIQFAKELIDRNFVASIDVLEVLREVREARLDAVIGFFINGLESARQAVIDSANVLIGPSLPMADMDVLHKEYPQVLLFTEIDHTQTPVREALNAAIKSGVDGVVLKRFQDFIEAIDREGSSLSRIRSDYPELLIIGAGGIFENQVEKVLRMPGNIIAAVGFNAQNVETFRTQADLYKEKIKRVIGSSGLKEKGMSLDSEKVKSSSTVINLNRFLLEKIIKSTRPADTIKEWAKDGRLWIDTKTLASSALEQSKAWQRLKGIGGMFPSGIKVIGDIAGTFTNRQRHVLRGLEIALRFASLLKRKDLYQDLIKIIAYAHELGRLPFAHFVEGKISEYLPNYSNIVSEMKIGSEIKKRFNQPLAQDIIYEQSRISLLQGLKEDINSILLKSVAISVPRKQKYSFGG